MDWWKTSEWTAFCTAVRIAPDDPTPKLIAADWLQDRGSDSADRRAQLIRAAAGRDPTPRAACGTLDRWYPHHGYARFRFRAPRPTAGTFTALASVSRLRDWDDHVSRAFPAVDRYELAGVTIVGGFLRAVAFHAGEFTPDIVTPPLAWDAAARVELDGCWPVALPHGDETRYGWYGIGVEWREGRTRMNARAASLYLADAALAQTELTAAFAGTSNEGHADFDALVNAGVSMERAAYLAVSGLIPGPVWSRMRGRKWADRSPSFAAAVEAMNAAAWAVCRAWQAAGPLIPAAPAPPDAVAHEWAAARAEARNDLRGWQAAEAGA